MSIKLEKAVASDEDSPVMRAIIESQARVFAAAYASSIDTGRTTATAIDNASNAMRAFYNNVQVPELD